MPDDKNPLNQLRDLVELKDQLEDIQKRVEDEIQAGIPPILIRGKKEPPEMLSIVFQASSSVAMSAYWGSLLASPFLKGFLAGYVVARLRSSALMGVVIGTCTGIYAAQTYAVPNIENTIKEYIQNLKGGRK